MIEAPARVVRIEGATAWVVPESPSSCGACAGKGCGSSIFSRMVHAGEEPEYQVENPIHAQPGDAVVVAVQDGTVLRAALAGYIMPLILVLIGALAGTLWGEVYSVAGAVTGLVVAVYWLRGRKRTASPVLVRLGSTACGQGN